MLKDCYAVILCGGRGTRMGKVTEDFPKSMIEVRSKPIIDYVIRTLAGSGFRKFIFPLGFKGGVIRSYVEEAFGDKGYELTFVETGDDTPIAARLGEIQHLLPEGGDFLLLNGDAIFNFDLEAMYQRHKKTDSWLTMASVEVTSRYGLIFEQNGEVVDFNRESRIDRYRIVHEEEIHGFIYSGIAWLSTKIFEHFDPKKCENFEWEVYPKIIDMKKGAHWMSRGSWFAIDTQKDLDNIEKNFEVLLPTVKI